MTLIGYGICVIAACMGIAIACYACCTSSARQPELAGRLFTDFIIGAALMEALCLIGFVLALIL